MSDEDVAEKAKRDGTTRAVASMEKACELDEKLIFAIGNAPTALIHLYELIRAGKIRPELVIGVPVGFVNVIQSKELILELSDTPYIVARGRKGEVYCGMYLQCIAVQFVKYCHNCTESLPANICIPRSEHFNERKSSR